MSYLKLWEKVRDYNRELCRLLHLMSYLKLWEKVRDYNRELCRLLHLSTLGLVRALVKSRHCIC